jgi:2-amino-4-hydroxy-6-hydroxymethyldihydropteridine diphosphokinase
MQNDVIIGLGSNIRGRQNIQKAIEILDSGFGVCQFSGPIITPPIGIENQPDFFNAVVLIKTSLSRDELNLRLKGIEDEMGRDRTKPKYGPREIDLDIVVWNGEVVDDDYYERDFLRKLINNIQ